MPFSKLTFWFGVVAPLALGSGACFLSTDDQQYDYDSYGYDTDGGCPVGAPGCACTISGQCDVDLTCIVPINTCVVPDGCAVGAPGCACTKGGTCDPGFICKETYCVTDEPCPPQKTGTESCQCTEGGGCDPGLECLSGLCVDTSGLDTDGSTDTGGSSTTASGSSDGGSSGDSSGGTDTGTVDSGSGTAG